MLRQEYTLTMLRTELTERLGVNGVMDAYAHIAEQTDKSVGEVRRWFSDPANSFHRKPPMDKAIWDYLEELSQEQLKRTTYYPKPNFWDKHV